VNAARRGRPASSGRARATRLELDGDRREQQDRGGEDERDRGAGHIEDALAAAEVEAARDPLVELDQGGRGSCTQDRSRVAARDPRAGQLAAWTA
jgi:hypothetical protein